MTKNISWLVEAVNKLDPEDRQRFDGELMKQLASDAEIFRAKYELTLATDYIEEAKELRKNWGKMQGLSSGLSSLDRLTKGFVDGELIVIGGATSNGKTSLAVNVAANILKQGHRVVFITMEMTRPQLTSRMLYVDDEFEDHAALLAYQRSEEFDWRSVDGLIANAKKELQAELVIIDHLHHFTRELDNVAEDLGRITKEFQKNAHNHQIPIIVISHTRKGEGVNIDDLRGSSYIAQDADIVLMVNRKQAMPDKIEVSIKKNRNRGYDFEDNEILLNFDKTKITELTDDPFND